MKLVKDNSPGAWAVKVICISPKHKGSSRMFTLAEGYADLDGPAFKAYYCNGCAEGL